MTFLIVIFLVVVLVPLLTSTWRVSLLGLCLQGVLMAWMALGDLEGPSIHSVLLLADLLVVRGIIAPAVLYRSLSRQDAPRRNDVIPPNLLSWAVAGGIVLVAFRFAHVPSLPVEESARTHLAVATSALLLGLFVLATGSSATSQIIGLLRVENAIALFELATPHHPPLAIQLGLTCVYVLTLATYALFLKRLDKVGPDEMPQQGASL